MARVRRLAVPLGIFAASRAALGVVLFFALHLPAAGKAARFLTYWDGGWYLTVAQLGYPRALAAAPGQTDHAFFPLYPWLIRALHHLTGVSWVRSAVAVNLLASAVAMVLIWVLVERLTDGPTATRAVTLISFFPWSFVLSMAYSEGLLLALAALCLLALLEERWVLAGIAALVAGAARPNGFVLALPCAWAALVALRRTRSLRPLVAPLLAPWGLLGFFYFLQRRTGDFLANLHARNRGWPYDGIGFHPSQTPKVLSAYLAHPLLDLNRTTAFAALGFVAVGLVLMARWRPPMIIWLSTVPIVVLAAFFDTYASVGRFALTAFPLLIAVARPLRGGIFAALIGLCAALMATLFILVGTTLAIVP
jgi:hypothetical protein